MFDYLISEEAKIIKKEVRAFVRDEIPHELIKKMDNNELQYPTEYLQKLGAHNMIAMRTPKEYGGRGLNWEGEVCALEEMGVLGSSLPCLYSLPIIVGDAFNFFGNHEQKMKYLKPMCEGKKFVAEALTEPRGGSDFFGSTCTAEKEGDLYILNGEKRFVVGGEGADFFLVYARTDLDLKANPHTALSLFIVDRTEGVSTEYLFGLLGTRGGGASRIKFTDVKIPKENIILAEGAGGKIFQQMMVPERLTTAAGGLGSARTCLHIATKYTTRRKAFGQEIKNFQGVSFKIADSITLLDVARSIFLNTAKSIDAGAPPALQRRLVSESKKFSTKACWKIINNAMQIMGGIGYTTVYPIERILRDSRIGEIWTGTTEIMNLIIQHEYYKELLSEKWFDRDVEQDAIDSEAGEEKHFG